MSACPGRERLALLLAEHLDGAECEQVESHVQTCPRCQEALTVLSDGDTDPGATMSTPTVGFEPRPEFLRRLREVGPDDGAGGGAAPGRAGGPEVPGYEILGELGRGGMGVVYKARQVKLSRLVALKMILTGAHAAEAERRAFRAEAEAVARLQHPGIVQVYEVGDSGGTPYLVLEYVAGGNLADLLDGTPLPPREAAELLRALAEAVHYAHGQGVVHRDLKPANVLLTVPSLSCPPSGAEGGSAPAPLSERRLNGAPKVTDFGLAKRLDLSLGRTQSGAVVGTPSYMAPEQAAGKAKQAGPATDVYALGAILYECLTGRPPFKAASPLDTLLQVVSDDPVPPRQLQPKVPRDLETVCLKCLAKEPRRRYASAGELAEELRRFLAGEPVRAQPVPAWERALRWAKRQPAAAALLAVSLAAAVSLTFVALLLADANRREREQREAAQSAEQRARMQGALAAYERDRAVAQRHMAYTALEEMWRQSEEKATAANPYSPYGYIYYPSQPGARPPAPKRDRDQEMQRKADLLKMLDFYQEFVGEEGVDEATRHQAASAHRRRGTILQRLARSREAEAAYRQSAAALEKLAKERPNAAAYRLELAASLLDLAALLKVDRRADALAVGRRAQAALEAAARAPRPGPGEPAVGPQVLTSYAAQRGVALSSILSGVALNALLKEVQKVPPEPGRPPDVPFDEAVLRKINLGRQGGSARLLRSAVSLQWPAALQEDGHRKDRLALEQLFHEAARQARATGRVAPEALRDGRDAYQRMVTRLTDHINEMTPTQYIEAKRFLNQINEALAALGRPDVAKYFNGDYDAKGMSLGDLVRHMTKNELGFAPALEGDEIAYLALHHAFVLYLETVKAP